VITITCLPNKVYDFLYPFKSYFTCPQAKHFTIFCWLLVLLILDQGKGTIKGLSRIAPTRIKYWTMMRMIRSGWWDANSLLFEMVTHVLVQLPPPADSTLYLIGDSTLKGKRGVKHPLARKVKINDYKQYTVGFEMVLMIASWGGYRLPVAIALIDPKINLTFELIKQQGYFYVFAIARTRKFVDGKHVSDLVRHLPKSHYKRVASYKVDGRRQDYWTKGM
jgi:hypothetical protein